MDANLKSKLEEVIRRLHVSEEIGEPRFGMIQPGEHVVKILEIQPFLASWNCSLDDNGKITNEAPKADFLDVRFDQPVVLIVFQNENGNVIMTRRSMKGWLTDTEVDKKTKKLVATPDFIREAKLKAVPAEDGNRFVDSNNKAFASIGKTETCAYFNNRFCKASGLPVGSSMLDAVVGTELMIKVEDRGERASKKTGVISRRSEVSDFALVTEGFKTHEVTAKEEVAAVPAPVELSWS
jgi:hypothetical protein